MATPKGSSATGAAHRHLHALATSQTLDIDFEKDIFAVGVLTHGKDLLTCEYGDLIFFKVKAKHSVARVRDAYHKRTQCQAAFKYAGALVDDSTKVRELNHMNDNIVIFTAHEEFVEPSPSSITSLPIPRNPLQQLNTQLSITPNNPHTINAKPLIKSEISISLNENNPSYPTIAPSPGLVVSPNTANTVTPLQNVPTKNGGPTSNLVHSQAVGLIIQNHTQHYAHNPSEQSQSRSQSPGQRFEVNSTSNSVKDEVNNESLALVEDGTNEVELTAKYPSRNERLSNLMQDASALTLEAEVKSSQRLLENLKKPLLAFASTSRDASHWIHQIENLQKRNVDTLTVIGVVGNTGAGKSSVINATLEEERLVPTNGMRACTAVVTEISWNSSDEPSKRYRAEIEFIRAEDWRKDIEISLKELVDGNGQLSRDCTNPESEAGVAYAKLRAVYPQKTREILSNTTPDQLMREPAILNVLGQVRKIEKGNSDMFYKALQVFIDSSEKSTADESKKKKKMMKRETGEKKQMEFWPLIKVVKIYVKADALSTGAVLVDLPGVHDSNAARAAVAAGYLKQCTGLFIVAPINRAVDDKAAKSLLGESFKRQLKFDGTYSRITFICSKTDDISVTEASAGLGLDEEISEDWERIDELEKNERELKQNIKDLNESKAVYNDLINGAEDALEVWDKLKDELEDGKEVFAPSDSSKKRKRSLSPRNSRKKSKNSRTASDIDEDFIDDGDEEETENSDSENASGSGANNEKGEPLTMDAIEAKIAELKADKKRARQEKLGVDDRVKATRQKLKSLEKNRHEMETAVRAICIEGRNKYSKGAIQRDFADGIRELDQEAAQEDDPDQFNPDEDLRDYEEVARSLPVFCVSSRAYQKLRGRFIRDPNIPGFRMVEETEIPQLQAHCQKLTEGGRASNCRAFLTDLLQLLNSLTLWASNDGTGISMTDAQLAAETRFLKTGLKTLEKSLEKAVQDCLKEMNDALAEHIFENYEQLVESAIKKATSTVEKWHQPWQRFTPTSGYHHSTYKAIMQRGGVYKNSSGEHDFNGNLIEPIIINLASHWEKVFAQKLPRVLTAFTRDSKRLLASFHKEVELRCIKNGSGTVGIGLLSQQLKTYDAIFVVVAQQLTEVINSLQREANRQFTPVIARALAEAYDASANEHGTGCFKRMKAIMSQNVEENKNDMFAESCSEVKSRLVAMCEQIEEAMSARTDEVFMKMQRDYMEVVAGTKMSDGAMPRWERRMRSDVFKAIEDHDLTAEENNQKAAGSIVATRVALKTSREADEEDRESDNAVSLEPDVNAAGPSNSAHEPREALKNSETVASRIGISSPVFGYKQSVEVKTDAVGLSSTSDAMDMS